MLIQTGYLKLFQGAYFVVVFYYKIQEACTLFNFSPSCMICSLSDSVYYSEWSANLLIKKEIEERRKVERVAVSLPVSMANTDFITHDISESGVFIETNESYDLGERIGFVVMFNKQGGHLILKCNGEIVRVENRNSKVGVAVKIIEAVMESA